MAHIPIYTQLYLCIQTCTRVFYLWVRSTNVSVSYSDFQKSLSTEVNMASHENKFLFSCLLPSQSFQYPSMEEEVIIKCQPCSEIPTYIQFFAMNFKYKTTQLVFKGHMNVFLPVNFYEFLMAFVVEIFGYFHFSQLWNESDRYLCIYSILATLLHKVMRISTRFYVSWFLKTYFKLYKKKISFYW